MAAQNLLLYVNTYDISLFDLLNGIEEALKKNMDSVKIFSHADDAMIIHIHSLKKLPPVKEANRG